MAQSRKSHDVVLPEVRKPAGYGKLVAVLPLDDGKRELWFQNSEEDTIIRCVEVNTADCSASKPVTIKTKGERDR